MEKKLYEDLRIGSHDQTKELKAIKEETKYF